MTHDNPINVATQKFLIHETSFSQDCSDPLPWFDETGQAIKEAKFIGNNIINVTVLTAKFKSSKELHMFHMCELDHPIMIKMRSKKRQLVI